MSLIMILDIGMFLYLVIYKDECTPILANMLS